MKMEIAASQSGSPSAGDCRALSLGRAYNRGARLWTNGDRRPAFKRAAKRLGEEGPGLHRPAALDKSPLPER